MLLHVVDALIALPLERVVVVVGHGAERVTKTLHEQVATELPIEFVEQRVQRGTGDAASVALTAFADDPDTDGDIIVMPGDAPLVRPEVLARLATEHRETRCRRDRAHRRARRDDRRLRTSRARRQGPPRPGGRAQRRARRRSSRSTRSTRRSTASGGVCSPRLCVGSAPRTRRASTTSPMCSRCCARPATRWSRCPPTIATAALHVNNRAQLAAAEAVLRERINDRWMREGVGMVDPARTYVDASVELEPDVRLLPGTILEGRTVIGAGSVVGPDTRLIDTVVGERCELRSGRRDRGRARQRRHRRSVRAPAARDAHRRRRPRRRLRRDQERRDRRGGQGAPPRLHRRRRDRRPGQHRRGHDHRQLRRYPTSTGPRSGPTRGSRRTPCWWRPSRSATAPTPARARW